MPLYSPELPPVEIFWLHIRQNILNTQMYETKKILKIVVPIYAEAT
ncbi:hypothetical protein [Holospora undulata]